MKMPQEILGYSQIEYLSVFVSFLYAFIVAEFFTGWARMLRNRESIVTNFGHTLYSLLFFWILILNWFGLWTQMEFLVRGFHYFVVVCIPIVLAYFAAVLMFPDFDKEHDLKSYFLKNFKLISLTTGSFILVNLIIALILGSASFSSTSTFVRIINSALLLVVGLFDLRKWIIPVGIIMAIALLAGSVKIAME